MTHVIPPIEDADRSQVYSTGLTTVSTIDLDYPLFGDDRDLKVFIDDVLLETGWTLSLISGDPVDGSDLPIIDGRITFSPVIGTGKAIEVRYVRQPRREVQPTAGGIGRREFNLVISDIVSTQRELRRDVESGVAGPTGATGATGAQGVTGAAGSTGPAGTDGDDGWTPIFSVVSDSSRRVLQVTDWTGGSGTKPATGKYVGATGLETLIANGVDIRGATGASGSGSGDMTKAVYDANDDGIVGHAALADAAPWTGISGKPTFFDGVYASLTSKPTLFDGQYSSLSGKPTLGTAAAIDTGATANKILKLDTNARAADGLGDLRSIPQSAKTGAYTLVALDAGKHISITTGGITVNSSVFAIGDAVTIYNNSASSQTITQGSGVTLRLAGTSTTGSRTLGLRGLCTILCVGTDEFALSGAGLT